VLFFLAGHERERELPSREQPDESLRVTAIGLHPVPGRLRDRPRRDHPQIKTTPTSRAREREPRWSRLIHSPHGSPQALQEHRDDIPRRAPQPLHTKLARQRIKDRRDRLRLVNIKPDKSHTLRHGRHLP
jgi:hypothetical protein